jgi:hypothetical protein
LGIGFRPTQLLAGNCLCEGEARLCRLSPLNASVRSSRPPWHAVASQRDLFGEDLAHQSKAVLETYFAPTLAGLLVKDAACQMRVQGICNLDFDPLFDSQDPRVTDLEVARASPGTVSVVYKDAVDGKTTRIDFEVARVAGKWKITDVVYRRPENTSLKQVLSRKIP